MSRASKPSSIARKIRISAYIFAGLLGLALVVPFLVDFSSFKPQIQSVIAQNVNAKVDFESARLQLIPSIGIKLKGVSLENTDPLFNGTKLFSVECLLVSAQLFALLTGKIVGHVEIDAPEFIIVKRGLKSNITALMKPSSPNSTSPVDQGSYSKTDTKVGARPITDPNDLSSSSAIKPAGLPDPQAQADVAAKALSETMAAIKEKVLIEGVYINGANITLRDLASVDASGAQVTAEPVRVRDLNIAVTNIGLDRDIKIRMDTKVDINEAGTSIKGPISVDKIVRVTMGGRGLEKATFVGKLSYDELLINYRDVFVKNPGIPLNMAFSGVLVPNDFNLETLVFNMHNIKIEAKAQVLNFVDPKLDADVKVANENLASLGDLLPKHKDMLVNGQLHLAAGVHGVISSLSTLEAKVDFDTKLAGTDLDIHLTSKGVSPFKGKLAVNSKRIDVDALIGPFQNKSGGPSTPQPPSKSTATDGKGNVAPGVAVDVDASQSAPNTLPVAESNSSAAVLKPATDFALTAEQKQTIQGTDAEVRVNLQEVNYTSQKLTNIIIDLDQKNLIGALNQFNIDGFGGKISASGKVDLASRPILFAIGFKMLEIHPEQVMAAIKPANKDLLVGRMNLDLAVTGSGTTVPTLNKTLNGSGSFRFLDGELHTKSIGSAMGEEFDQYLTTLSAGGAGQAIFDSAEKLLNSPLAKALGKSPPDIAKMKEQYQSSGKMKLTDKTSANKSLKDVNGKIEIKAGRVYVVSATTDSSGTMNFNSFFDLELKLGGTSVYTASAATIERLKSQSKYADLLLDDKNNLTIAMTLGGTIVEPKVTIGSAAMRESFTNKAKILIEKEVKAAAEVYLNSLMGGGAQKAEAAKKIDEAKAKAAEQLKSPENKKKAEAALKGLFGK